jgi:hypothetical protein
MVLKFSSRWRFEAPKVADETANRIPEGAIQEFLRLIRKTATQGDLKEFLKHYKGYFCAGNGTTHYPSSNSSWAETDLESKMLAAAANPPLFLEAFFDASEAIRRRRGDLFAPESTRFAEFTASRTRFRAQI